MGEKPTDVTHIWLVTCSTKMYSTSSQFGFLASFQTSGQLFYSTCGFISCTTSWWQECQSVGTQFSIGSTTEILERSFSVSSRNRGCFLLAISVLEMVFLRMLARSPALCLGILLFELRLAEVWLTWRTFSHRKLYILRYVSCGQC